MLAFTYISVGSLSCDLLRVSVLKVLSFCHGCAFRCYFLLQRTEEFTLKRMPRPGLAGRTHRRHPPPIVPEKKWEKVGEKGKTGREERDKKQKKKS